jgi:beta-mannosidase
LQVEDLRRLKYRPTGGFLHFCFADSLPAVTWSVLDHTRAPKMGYGALRDACRPVLGILDPRTGDVHVVNEGREALEGVVVDTRVGERRHRWAGDVPADGIVFVGRVEVGDASTATVVVSHPAAGEVVNEYGPVLMHAARNRPAKITL